MLFTSLEFLLFFLPIVILVYIVLPRKAQNVWLFVTSLFFYAWGEPFFVLVMAGSIVINFFLALLIDANKDRIITRRVFLVIDVLMNLGILFVYKYMNFVTSILHQYNSSITVTEYVLPIGISFYTFQALSYVVDVYRGEKAQKNLINVGLYIALFPQLIAGPIVRYGDIKDQLIERKTSLDKFSDGIFKFLIGFNKKMLIANMVAIIADQAFAADTTRTVFMAWIGALCYTLQIYFDFSGYSDMAIGLGKMMGFELPKNFDYPYCSRTITEFWRRWHISLGSWFKDYLYFPLGGSRVSGKARLVFNLMFVWLMTGIWHGANMTFILWGIMYGIFISIEKIFSIPSRIQKKKYAGKLYRVFTMIVVMIGWVIFRSDNLSAAHWYLLDLLGLRGGGIILKTDIFWVREYGIYIVFGLLFSFPIIEWAVGKIKNRNSILDHAVDAALYIANIALFVIGVSYLVISAHNPFIYFNF
ncbi:MAG: MBOAT family protein [Solobacterium sp.]|nr:MBOAT family protein [Solobacterium sp.]MBR3310974.1 MBOAT family protein [Solobacterium sp.]